MCNKTTFLPCCSEDTSMYSITSISARKIQSYESMNDRSSFPNEKRTIVSRRISPFSTLLPSIIFTILSTICIQGRLLDTSVSCDQNNFVLSLNFDTPFQGIVYSEEGFPNCVYVNGTMLSHTSYQLKIPLNGCETRANIDGNYENAIIIQESPSLLQSTDKKYLLTCIPSPSSNSPLSSNSVGGLPPTQPFASERGENDRMGSRDNMITVDFGGVTVENSHTTTEIIRGMLPSGVGAAPSPELKYAVEIRHGHSLDSPTIATALNIGDPISYMVRLQKPVADSQIGRCWATDSKSNLELADERGCSLQPRGNIWGAFDRLETNKEVVFINRIKAWAFPTSNEVNIFCNLRICMSRLCSFANCTEVSDSAMDASNRRRRHHQNNSKMTATFSELTEIETLRTRIRFRRHSAAQSTSSEVPLRLLTSEEANSVPKNQSALCLKSAELWLIAGCAFLFLVVIILFVVVILRYHPQCVSISHQKSFHLANLAEIFTKTKVDST